MTNNSIQLSKLWVCLKEMKDNLDNTILPLGGYLGIEDPELMIAMEELSEKIQKHFDRFRLVAEAKTVLIGAKI